MDNSSNPTPDQNPNYTSPQQNLPPQNNKSSHAWLIILVVILLITNAVTFYFFYNKNDKESIQNNSKNTPTNTIDDVKMTKEKITEEDGTIEGENNEDEIKLAADEILVDWYEEPIISSAEELFGINKIDQNKENVTYSLLSNDLTVEKSGIIKAGQYENNELYSVSYPSMSTVQSYFIKTSGKVYLVSEDNNYDRCASDSYKYLCEDKNLKFANLETPQTINIPNSNIILSKKDYNEYRKFEDTENYSKLFEYATDKYLYQIKSENGKALTFFTVAEDKTIRLYGLDFAPLTKNTSDKYLGTTPKVLDITWVDGTSNSDEFLQDGMGMYRGSNSYAYYIQNKNELKIAGYLKNGNPIYELKDINKKRTEDAEYSIYEDMYRMHYVPEGQEKLPFDDFIKQHLLIFWEDPFGNMIEFQNSAYAPAVEMGKPVIYLYPEETTNISVKVYPNNGLSITEPLYNNGWLVEAQPNGILYNYTDSQNYPYLFWEGHGLNYDMPKNGFVVAKEDIENFLADKLALQGLLPNEYDEFIDFWSPKMKEYDYYFITFLEQEYFDTLAPLEINPQPNTTIRVFMDYRGLEEKIEVEEIEFTTPIREGFTVVEWGGALH